MNFFDYNYPSPLRAQTYESMDDLFIERDDEYIRQREAEYFYKTNKDQFTIGRGREFYEAGALTSLKRACKCLVNGSSPNINNAAVRLDMAFLASKFPGFAQVAELFGRYWECFATQAELANLREFLGQYDARHSAYNPRKSLFDVVTSADENTGCIEYGLAEEIIKTRAFNVYSNVSIAEKFSPCPKAKLLRIIRKQVCSACRADLAFRLSLGIPKHGTFHSGLF